MWGIWASQWYSEIGGNFLELGVGSGGLEEVRVRVRADNHISADQKTENYTGNFNHTPGQPAIATSTTRAALQLHIHNTQPHTAQTTQHVPRRATVES